MSRLFALALFIAAVVGFVLGLYAPPAFSAESSDNGKIDRATVERVQAASYRLYIRVSPPGRRTFQTIAFCSASFYEYPIPRRIVDEGIYGTTAGHCLDGYKVLREKLKSRWWGLKFSLVVSPKNDASAFVTVEAVDDGFKSWRQWREDDEGDIDRPEPSAVQDWGIIRAPADAPLNTLGLALDDNVRTGDRIYVSGHPWALGKFWSSGQATYPYQLPGTAYDDYIATDAPAAPGSSGAPVVDAKGRQVGILVAGIPNGLSLVTPISVVQIPQEYPYKRDKGYESANVATGFGYGELMNGSIELPEDMQAIQDQIESFLAPAGSAESSP